MAKKRSWYPNEKRALAVAESSRKQPLAPGPPAVEELVGEPVELNYNPDYPLRRQFRAMATTLLSLVAMTAVVTSSFFTSSEASSANVFTTGTLDLAATPATASLSFAAMQPGDRVVDDVVVTNNGTLGFRYALTSTTTGDNGSTDGDDSTLASQLQLTVWVESAEADADAACGLVAPGVVLYGPASLGSPAGTALFGNPSTGAHPGDRVLPASTEETLCFRAILPYGTPATFEDLTTTATFSFAGEQITNN